MRHFGMRHFAGLALPAESDVRSGITYGPNSSLTGALAVPDPPDIEEGNLSQVEETETYQLDSYYAIAGIHGDYVSRADDTTISLVFLLLSRVEVQTYDDAVQVLREDISVLLRRYGDTAIQRPTVGDRLSIPSFDGTRKYMLTQTPVASNGQLEWKAEFSRTRRVKAGGREVVGQV